MAGGGGVLITPDGKIDEWYVWGLGKKTNNQAEAYGLLLGLTLAQQKRIRILNVMGESLLIIKSMINNREAKNSMLNQILKRI